jgi:hypothetical protein
VLRHAVFSVAIDSVSLPSTAILRVSAHAWLRVFVARAAAEAVLFQSESVVRLRQACLPQLCIILQTVYHNTGMWLVRLASDAHKLEGIVLLRCR